MFDQSVNNVPVAYARFFLFDEHKSKLDLYTNVKQQLGTDVVMQLYTPNSYEKCCNFAQGWADGSHHSAYAIVKYLQ